MKQFIWNPWLVQKQTCVSAISRSTQRTSKYNITLLLWLVSVNASSHPSAHNITPATASNNLINQSKFDIDWLITPHHSSQSSRVSSAVSRPTTTTCPPVNLDGLLVSTVLSNQQHHVSISWLTEQLLTSPPTQYRLSGRRKLTGQKTQPTVSKYWRKSRYKSKENPGKKQTTQNTAIQ